LRPVLITTLTTTLALVPMASGIGEGSEVWAPLGRIVVGGLSVSALFTLFFIPALYSLIEEQRTRFHAPSTADAAPTDSEVSVAD
jgi:HAE1 family hydrophobic/amphiphilic exporter-1